MKKSKSFSYFARYCISACFKILFLLNVYIKFVRTFTIDWGGGGLNVEFMKVREESVSKKSRLAFTL